MCNHFICQYNANYYFQTLSPNKKQPALQRKHMPTMSENQNSINRGNNALLPFLYNRDIPDITLSLGLLSPPNPSFSGIRKVRKFY